MRQFIKLLTISWALTINPNSSATLPSESEIAATRNKLVIVNLRERTLKFIDSGKLIKQYRIGIGKPKTPTPVGKGYIRSKGQMVFYQDNGKVLRYTRLENGKWIKIPYRKMLGFGISIPGYDPFQYYIHSTVNDAAVDAAISKGCVRMKIPDMLEFYPMVDVGTRIIIKK